MEKAKIIQILTSKTNDTKINLESEKENFQAGVLSVHVIRRVGFSLCDFQQFVVLV